MSLRGGRACWPYSPGFRRPRASASGPTSSSGSAFSFSSRRGASFPGPAGGRRPSPSSVPSSPGRWPGSSGSWRRPEVSPASGRAWRSGPASGRTRWRRDASAGFSNPSSSATSFRLAGRWRSGSSPRFGAVVLVKRRSRGAIDLALVLVPLFLSLWFLHNRSMSRYSVPFALVVSLLFGAGLEAVFRRRVLGFFAAVAAAALFARETWPEVLRSARETTPPDGGDSVPRTLRPPRARDDRGRRAVFHAFLRTEIWEGRLAVWGYTTTDFVSGYVQTNATARPAGRLHGRR